MAIEQSLHYCLSESKVIVWTIYDQPLGSNVQTVQLTSLHSHFIFGTNFFGMLVDLEVELASQ